MKQLITNLLFCLVIVQFSIAFTVSSILAEETIIHKNVPVVSESVQINNLLLQKHPIKNIKTLEQRVHKGKAEAQFQLALQLRSKSEYRETNLKEAFELLVMSAGQSGKHAGAQCALARAYFLGEGTEKNIISAYIWASISYTQNTLHKADAEILRNIAKKYLNQQQINKADDIFNYLKKQLIKTPA